jgi:hypothetical protein
LLNSELVGRLVCRGREQQGGEGEDAKQEPKIAGQSFHAQLCLFLFLTILVDVQ